MKSKFNRSLSAAFIKTLEAEALRGGWWADVLADPKLLIAVRDNCLNVYWRGQSMFRVTSVGGGFRVTTHEKYLVNPELASQVPLKDRHFDISSLVERGFIRSYVGPATIKKMKSASGLFTGIEKTGCHEIAVRNPTVIDCEIAFPGVDSPLDGVTANRLPRVDFASLETDDAGARLVFWEAKVFDNGDLRAQNGAPLVCTQVNTYMDYLFRHRQEIERSYTKVAANLVSLKGMGMKRQLSSLITDVASGKRRLTLGAEPKVGLIIFGYDSAQRDHAAWRDHLSNLTASIPQVIAVGDVKKVNLPK